LLTRELQELRSIADQLPADENKQLTVQDLENQIGEIPNYYNNLSAQLSGELLEEQQFRQAVNDLQNQLENPIGEMSPADYQEFLVTELPLLREQVERLKGDLCFDTSNHAFV
jgi:hypothetical protein